jgi:hypothetical protein
MKTLYTSYYARSGKRPGAISISAKAPFFYKGDATLTLAPSWELLRAYKEGKIDAYGYTEWFGRLLKERNLTPRTVIDNLKEGATMLCYEKVGDFCHRHIVAVWLNQSGLAQVYELQKDGTPMDTPTSVEDLIVLLDVDTKEKTTDNN